MTARLLLGISVFLFGLGSASADVFRIVLDNGSFTLEAEVSRPEHASQVDGEEIILRNMIAIKNGRRYYLEAEFGWGDRPLGQICEQVGEQLDIEDLSFASTYGFVTPVPFWRSFGSPQKLVVYRNGTYQTGDADETYNSGMLCSTIDKEY